MRRFLALSSSAALEALAEPLSAILFLVALLTIHLAPVFHYHQFGEAGRLARECGFSALIVFGLILATAAAVRSVGGEIASGTAAAALARPVSRPLFFCAKVAGVSAFFGAFFVAVAAATLLAVLTSETGTHLADCCEGHEASRLWAPGLACGICGTLGSFAAAALANRFLRTRFCVGACLLMAVGQPAALLAALPFGHDGFAATASSLAWPLLPALAVLACGCTVFIAFAGALSVRLKPAPTAALVAAAVLSAFVWPVRAVLPAIGRFWMVDSLAGGGSVPCAEIAAAVAAAACLTAFWLVAGSLLLRGRELP